MNRKKKKITKVEFDKPIKLDLHTPLTPKELRAARKLRKEIEEERRWRKNN